MPRPLLEIIACSAEDCRVAQLGGADRIELCSAIELGGLTPSIGLLERALSQTTLPIMAMVRPRSGGFNYSDEEFEQMLTDVQRFKEAGAHGAVFGVLTDHRTLDTERMALMVEASGKMETVCHRAFDATADPLESFEELIRLGVTRVLTSGQRATALEGRDLIKKLVEEAAGRLQVLPGSGLKPFNVAEFVAHTGVNQVHMTAFEEVADHSMDGVGLAFNSRAAWESAYHGVEKATVEAIVKSL